MVHERESLLPLLRESDQLLVLGRSGSGKTSLLEECMRELAAESLSGRGSRVPIFVDLKRIAPAAPADTWVAGALAEAVEQVQGKEFSLHAFRSLAPLVPQLRDAGLLTIFWDGLNELPEAQIEEVARKLERLRREHPGPKSGPHNQHVISCRRDTYRLLFEQKQRHRVFLNPLAQFQVASVLNLAPEHIERFITNYLGTNLGAVLSEQLSSRRHSRLRRLTRTPLLLQMICDVFRSTQTLPGSRSSLLNTYLGERISRLITERLLWEGAHQSANLLVAALIQDQVLNELAFVMKQRRGGSGLRWKRARRIIDQALRHPIAATLVNERLERLQARDDVPKERLQHLAAMQAHEAGEPLLAAITARDLCRLGCDADLLTFSDLREFHDKAWLSYSHDTVREFFTAAGLLRRLEARVAQPGAGNGRQLGRYARTGAHTGWEGTMLMAAGIDRPDGRPNIARQHLNSFVSKPLAAAAWLLRYHDGTETVVTPEVCEALVAFFYERGHKPQEYVAAAHALGHLATATQVPPEVHERVRQLLCALMRDPQWPVAIRIEAGASLGDLGALNEDGTRLEPEWCGDPRLGVTSLTPDWCLVPAGPFYLGAHPQDRHSAEWERPWRLVNLPAFRISRYPVTCAQWRRFMHWGGPKRWRDALEGTPDFSHYQYLGLLDGWEEESYQANFPVLGITLEDAMAYCSWLSAQLGYRVYLPTEAQWEKAARGPEGQLFPWGWGWDITRANTSDLARHGLLRRPSLAPVGCFAHGASPYGVEDMAGNVLEWTWSVWTDDYSRADGTIPSLSVLEEGTVTGLGQVVRGGSWENGLSEARCSFRYWANPTWFGQDRPKGFRVVTDALGP